MHSEKHQKIADERGSVGGTDGTGARFVRLRRRHHYYHGRRPARPSRGHATTTPRTVANTSIVIAINGEPTSMDALTKEDGNMRAVTEQIYEPLTCLDAKTLDPVPMLATEWSQPDATTWQFKIREGVKFHNGEPFTVDDAVASINKEVDPATKSEIAGNSPASRPRRRSTTPRSTSRPTARSPPSRGPELSADGERQMARGDATRTDRVDHHTAPVRT